MEKVKDKSIVIKIEMGDHSGRLIPRGVRETLKIEIIDGFAVFWFHDSRSTERFARVLIEQQIKGKEKEKTIWNSRLKKAMTIYNNMTKEQIRDKLLKELEGMVKG